MHWIVNFDTFYDFFSFKDYSLQELGIRLLQLKINYSYFVVQTTKIF